MTDEPLISCLCVTRNRVPLLKRAVACFLSQTHPARELIILWETDDSATRDYLSTLDMPSIRTVELGIPRLPLGSLRNVALQHSRGHYVAQWDDDDWYAPNRLAEQLKALQASGKPACVLLRWTMFDAETGKAYLSGMRPWEGSMMAEKTAVPPYPHIGRREDTHVVLQMLQEGKLTYLDAPHLYVYVFHGANTWNRGHWQQWLSQRGTRELPLEEASRVRSVVNFPG